MGTVDVVAMDGGRKAGSLDLDPAVWEAPVKPHLFHAEVRRQLAVRRAGTHASRNRGAVSGGGAKPYRQKGTGRARQGTIRAPQWAGGGAVFGPVPRGHGHALPKKVRRAALRGAVSLRQREGSVVVVDALELGAFKTRRVAEILAGLGLAGASVLIVVEAPNHHLEVSARNLPRVTVIRAEGLNTYDVLRHQKLLLTREAVASLERRLGSAAGGEEGGA
jgi:large subunit ribosomal protein L4